MGEISDDIREGECCAECGMYFTEGHGYPVFCNHCTKQWKKENRAGLKKMLARTHCQKAHYPLMGEIERV